MKHSVTLVLAASMVLAAHAAEDAPVDKSAALTPQSGDGPDIRSLFNENADRVRLMVLLSPT